MARPRLTESQYQRHLDNKNAKNVLVIGDLHAPFIREGYLDHCKRVRDEYYCDQVIYIGDVQDCHASSYHETDVDGYSAGEELERTIAMLKPWHDEFGEAFVTIGNHDRIIARKAMTAGLSKRWVRDYHEVLETPKWRFVDHVFQDDVMYVHGDGAGHATVRAKKDLTSVVQGHWHSKSYVEFHVGRRYKVFAMQVGCGVNQEAYSMAYGKNGPRMAISCGVVLNNGQLPIVIPMEL